MAWHSWLGGRYWQGRDGRRRYFIRRSVGDRRVEVNTGATTEEAAREHLVRFERNPERYRPEGDLDGRPVILDTTLIDAFIEARKANTRPWLTRQRRCLEWWSKRLGRTDLRLVRRGELLGIAEGKGPGVRPYLATLKAFFTYLRRDRGLIERNGDPTIDIPLHQPKPAQWVRRRLWTDAEFNRLLPALSDTYADVLRLLYATGAHLTEVVRFARGGSVQYRLDGTVVLSFPKHKNGLPHVIEVEQETAAVAHRVVARGSFSANRLYEAVKDARVRLGVREKLAPGGMRHGFAHRAVERGIPLPAIATYLGHSQGVNARFYSNLAAKPLPGRRTGR